MDIVEWLRQFKLSTSDSNYNAFIVNGKIEEAADEIERLRGALQKISAVEDEHINPPTTPSEANLWCIIDGCVRVAEKALGGK